MPHIGHTIPSSGGGGAVTSVATRTGDVVLTAADVGAGTWPGAVKAGAALRLGTQTISGTATLVTGTADVILADTTSAAFTITLPAAPTAGDIFIFVDSAGQWATNNLTIALNGKNLNASASNAVLTQVNGTFGIYYDGTAWHSIIHAPSDTNPVMDGTAAPGTAFGYSRRDHVHPSDTSRAPASGIANSALATNPLARANHTGTQTASTVSDFDTQVATTAALKATLTTKGDIYAASAASTPARLAVGTHLTHRVIADTAASSGLKWIPHVIGLSADATAITANTTLADTALTMAIAASEVWVYQFMLFYTAANVTMDVKATVTAPSGATGSWGTVGVNTFAGFAPIGTGSTQLALKALAASDTWGGPNNGESGVYIGARVVCSATPGNVTLQLAQATSDAGALTLKAGASMIGWRVA